VIFVMAILFLYFHIHILYFIYQKLMLLGT
jgi:hypothetical protein